MKGLGWILILIVIGLILSPFISEWIRTGELGEGKGWTTIGLTLYFEDGTSEEVKMESFSLVPLTIMTESEKAVSCIEVNVYATPVFTIKGGGSINQYRIAGTMDLNIHDGFADLEPPVLNWQFNTFDALTYPDTTWESGTEKKLVSSTYFFDSLEDVLKPYGEGSYTLSISSHLTLTLYPDTGEPSAMDAFGSCTWNFVYDSHPVEISSLNVRVEGNPLT